MAKLRLGALEAGGTKMVCAIGDEMVQFMSRYRFLQLRLRRRFLR